MSSYDFWYLDTESTEWSSLRQRRFRKIPDTEIIHHLGCIKPFNFRYTPVKWHSHGKKTPFWWYLHVFTRNSMAILVSRREIGGINSQTSYINRTTVLQTCPWIKTWSFIQWHYISINIIFSSHLRKLDFKKCWNTSPLGGSSQLVSD